MLLLAALERAEVTVVKKALEIVEFSARATPAAVEERLGIPVAVAAWSLHDARDPQNFSHFVRPRKKVTDNFVCSMLAFVWSSLYDEEGSGWEFALARQL